MERLQHYHDVMGVPMPAKCKIFFHEQDWVDNGQYSEKYNDRILNGDFLGSNRGIGKTLFINLDRGDSRKSVENTIVHEIMHTKYDELGHGLRYDSYCWQISNGKYPPSFNPIKAVYHWVAEAFI